MGWMVPVSLLAYTAAGLPEGVTCDASLWAACIGGAAQRDDYLATIRAAGFDIDTIRENDEYRFLSDRAVGPPPRTAYRASPSERSAADAARCRRTCSSESSPMPRVHQGQPPIREE